MKTIMCYVDFIFGMIKFFALLFAFSVFSNNFMAIMETAATQQLNEMGASLLATLIIIRGFVKGYNNLPDRPDTKDEE